MNLAKTDEAEIMASRNPSHESPSPANNTSCFICLSEPMVDPFTLPRCGHTYCFGCLQKWQSVAPERSCPACREGAPDVVESVHEMALLHSCRAANNDFSEDEQKRHLDLALEELDKFDPTNDAMTVPQKIRTLFTRGQILLYMSRPAEALDIFEQVEVLSKEGNPNRDEMIRSLAQRKRALQQWQSDEAQLIGRILKHDVYATRLGTKIYQLYMFMAECKEGMGEYRAAIEIYCTKVMAGMGVFDLKHHYWAHDENPPGVEDFLLNMFKKDMSMARCMYLLGDYELSISVGESAIETNRSFPQVHKYVALSQKASGNLEAAIRTMGRALNHEAPWDKANRKKVLEMYKELKGSADASVAG